MRDPTTGQEGIVINSGDHIVTKTNLNFVVALEQGDQNTVYFFWKKFSFHFTISNFPRKSQRGKTRRSSTVHVIAAKGEIIF